jgi:hypothetical protein
LGFFDIFFYILIPFILVCGWYLVQLVSYVKQIKFKRYTVDDIDTFDTKQILAKQAFLIIYPNLILFSLTYFLDGKYIKISFYLYDAIMILIIGIGFRNELLTYRIHFKQILIPAIVICVDVLIHLLAFEYISLSAPFDTVYYSLFGVRVLFVLFFIFLKPRKRTHHLKKEYF